VIGIAKLNSIPGRQAISTIYWYEQLRRHSVQRSVAAFELLVSSLLGIDARAAVSVRSRRRQ
jgi:hypothetical protein